MTKQKALIITYYDAPNYGAFLQAYAMQEFLRTNGVEGEVLGHRAYKPTVITKLLDKRLPLAVIDYRNQIQKRVDEAQRYLNVTAGKGEYDLAIIGSDEIWNVKNLTAIHLPAFFRPYARAKKTISYAACAGKCQGKHMKLLPYTCGIRKLNAVSVRDEYTELTIKDFGVENPVRTLDPTFLYDFGAELPERTIQEDYLLVYTYGLGQEEIDAIQNFARKQNLKIIATGSRCGWADENPVPAPFEWLSLIKYSKYVVTSTFHGSVFSIILNKQFVAIATQSNKVKSLLNELRLNARLVTQAERVEAVLTETIDFAQVNEIKQEKRNASAAFVFANL